MTPEDRTTPRIQPLLPEIDFGVADVPDFHERMAGLCEAGHRVVPVRYNGEIAWVILRHDDVAAAYVDAELPAAPAYIRHSMPVQGRTLLCMEGDEHRVNRLLVSKAFQPSAIRRLADRLLLPLANELIDELEGRTEVDLVAGYTHRYPFSVITRMLGIPDEDHGQLVEWVDGLFAFPWDPDLARRASRDFTDYLAPIVAERRRHPAQDVISMLATAEAEGQRLTDEEIYSFIRLLFPAGADTTYLSIGSLMLSVLKDPGSRRRLLDDPEQRVWAVEESLRLNGTIGLQPRYTERAVTIAGVDIPADSVLLYGNATANHDPAVFPDPHRFDLDRHPGRLLTFGKGVHFCLGAQLARLEGRVGLETTQEFFPNFEIEFDDPVRAHSPNVRGFARMPIRFSC